MYQLGFLDYDIRLSRIDKAGDPLKKIDEVVDWEVFRPLLEEARKKEKRKSNAGAKGYDVVLLFKVLILQSLYNLSDEETEYQILDRYSFSRFVGIKASEKVPDATTLWRFREGLVKAKVVEKLFKRFDRFLGDNGYRARKGQIVDASIVRVPIQRNSREENQKIKEGKEKEIEGWSEAKRRQKDTDARWTKKHGRSYFGYKNHVSVDVKNKFIRGYKVTSANIHDSQVFGELLDKGNSSKDVWADSAYRSGDNLEELKKRGYREHLQRKGNRHKKLSEREKLGNRTKSRIRSRIEHVFGVQAQKAGDLILRTIGIARARCKIGLRNLAYNIDRYGTLCAMSG